MVAPALSKRPAQGRIRHANHRGLALLALGFGTVAYTYLGYPLLIATAAHRRTRARGTTPAGEPPDGPPPELSVVVPALNEERVIADKVLDLCRQDLPAERIIVVADGSEDRTADIARS